MRRPMRSTRTRRRQTLAIRRQIPIRRCKSLTEAALQDGPASFDQRSYDRALINSQVRSEIYERDVSPGFGARTQETVAQYGPLRGAAEHVIAASPAVAEICEYIMDNPESIAALNSMSKHEVELFVARQEGHLQALKPQPQMRTVSQAPRPVSTVSGQVIPQGHNVRGSLLQRVPQDFEKHK